MHTEAKRTFSAADLDPIAAYKMGTSLVAPRPIGWIGTRNTEGVTNLAPYSFFNMVAASPPTFVFSPALNGRRDTLDNVTATNEFTVNIVTEATAAAMNKSAGSFPADESEFDQCGLTAVDAETISAPMVAEAIANFECVVTSIVPIGKAADGPTNMLVMGEATRIHVAERIVDERFNVDQQGLQLVGRHAGGLYSRTADTLFELERPQ